MNPAKKFLLAVFSLLIGASSWARDDEVEKLDALAKSARLQKKLRQQSIIHIIHVTPNWVHVTTPSCDADVYLKMIGRAEETGSPIYEVQSITNVYCE